MMRERAKGDRLEDHMKEARVHEDREADDNAIYDLVDLTVATTASSKVRE